MTRNSTISYLPERTIIGANEFTNPCHMRLEIGVEKNSYSLTGSMTKAGESTKSGGIWM
jgi:hypothetical protein